MSVQRECMIIEFVPGRWYAVVEDCGAPNDSWDWREYASCFGPAASEDAAWRLIDHLPNPGGGYVVRFDSTYAERERDEVLAGLIENAQQPLKLTPGWGGGTRFYYS